MKLTSRMLVTAAIFALELMCTTRSFAAPPLPVGLDAYREWFLWPYQRIGERAYMRSTYDRTGGNEGADASHFLYQTADNFNVALDLEGQGVLCFARFNHWHGSPWHFEVDHVDHLVSETSTTDPRKPAAGSVFLPIGLFPEPLAWTWATTKGADLIGVPMPFTTSLTLAYSRTHYGTGYYIYDQFVPGTRLSLKLKSWDGKTPPDQDVLKLISRSGSDLTQSDGINLGASQSLHSLSGSLSLGSGETKLLEKIAPGGKSMLRTLELSAPRNEAVEFGKARIRITWDDRSSPSVDAPVALFFGAGTLYNRDSREYLVKAFPVNIRFDDKRVNLACFFPMPFFRSATLELVGNGESDLREITWSAKYEPYHGRESDVGYFHATYRDHGKPIRGQDLVLLDTRETEGGGNWSGSFVGTSFIFSDRARLGTLEGDPRFFFDDSRTPQAQGTGTEEWGGGGDYWGGANMTLPFYGHPTGARDEKSAKCDDDQIESAYRFLLADLMPFGRNAVIRLEHGGVDESEEHYQSVAYWYGLPSASLLLTDQLKIGDAASEAAHDYNSPLASPPYVITSRYEWGPDSLGGVETYPAKTDIGRKTVGMSEFTLKLDPHNLGVMLRRKLDYAYANQRAEVYIADVEDAGDEAQFIGDSVVANVIKGGAQENQQPNWRFAGIWYLAGSNTCVYSNPQDELGPAQHIVETSNRRFRDDEFLIPLGLTKGRSAIRVRVKFTPITRPLYPGYPLAELAWSEMRYDAYCFVTPDFKIRSNRQK